MTVLCFVSALSGQRSAERSAHRFILFLLFHKTPVNVLISTYYIVIVQYYIII